MASDTSKVILSLGMIASSIEMLSRSNTSMSEMINVMAKSININNRLGDMSVDTPDIPTDSNSIVSEIDEKALTAKRIHGLGGSVFNEMESLFYAKAYDVSGLSDKIASILPSISDSVASNNDTSADLSKSFDKIYNLEIALLGMEDDIRSLSIDVNSVIGSAKECISACNKSNDSINNSVNILNDSMSRINDLVESSRCEVSSIPRALGDMEKISDRIVSNAFTGLSKLRDDIRESVNYIESNMKPLTDRISSIENTIKKINIVDNISDIKINSSIMGSRSRRGR